MATLNSPRMPGFETVEIVSTEPAMLVPRDDDDVRRYGE